MSEYIMKMRIWGKCENCFYINIFIYIIYIMIVICFYLYYIIIYIILFLSYVILSIIIGNSNNYQKRLK